MNRYIQRFTAGKTLFVVKDSIMERFVKKIVAENAYLTNIGHDGLFKETEQFGFVEEIIQLLLCSDNIVLEMDGGRPVFGANSTKKG